MVHIRFICRNNVGFHSYQCRSSYREVDMAILPTRILASSTEGGWGCILTLATAVMFIVSVGPLSAFGILHGKYLAQLGDEAGGTSTINSIFNTLLCLMGLTGHQLLQRFSCRFVGIIGSIMLFLGNFLTIFASSVAQLTITLGFMQGIGFGLMLCATLTSFNYYFVERKNLIMGISQTMVGAAVLVIPEIVRSLKTEYGYRGTVALISAFSLHGFAAMLTLQSKPKTKPVSQSFQDPDTTSKGSSKNYELVECKLTVQDKTCYMNSKSEHLKSLCSEKALLEKNPNEPVEETRKKNVIWKSIYNFLELSLLKDFSYVNIAFGVALSITSDMMFLPLLPTFLNQLHYDGVTVSMLMTVYMGSDFFGRILLALFNVFVTVSNRSIFLFGTVFTAIVRIMFTFLNGYHMWMTATCIVLLGMLRCLIQVTFPLVLAEYSSTRFTAVYGLYQLICAAVSLSVLPLAHLIKSLSAGNVWVIHLLTIYLLLCGLPWIFELTFTFMKNKISYMQIKMCNV